MKTFNKYIIRVLLVLGVVLSLVEFAGRGKHFAPASHICHGFLLGYLAAWFHIGCRSGFGKLSGFLDNSGS
jgi:hypothetical protein